jgi:UDP-glucose 4-epimerase
MKIGNHVVLVTGGAGFIGSHLVDRLMDVGCDVIVVDNLSAGRLENLGRWLKNSHFRFVRGDLKEPRDAERVVRENVDVVFHFAANPEVRVGETNPKVHFDENLRVTYNLLEAMRTSNSAKTIVFASTSTVYGEAAILPTPEDYGPLIPISTYGASKLGCEALISAYAYTFGLRGLILRFANVVGPRATVGVVLDFIEKLRNNPNQLVILGDGLQKKSYLYIDDCVDAVFCAFNAFLDGNNRVDVYNVGSLDQVDVNRIAELVVEEMDLKDVEFVYSSGVEGGRGWRGDVKFMHLSSEKLRKHGWKPKYKSEEAIRIAARILSKI